MYTLFDSAEEDLVCGSKTFAYNDQFMPEGSATTFKPLDPDASPQVRKSYKRVLSGNIGLKRSD